MAEASAKRRKRRLLPQRDVRFVVRGLHGSDREILMAAVVKGVEAEHHIQYFDHRKQLWCYLNGKGKAQLAELLNISLLSFCTTYEGGAKGAVLKLMAMIYLMLVLGDSSSCWKVYLAHQGNMKLVFPTT